MKKSTLQFMLMLIVTLAIQAIVTSSWAQAPQKMSYQAVIRNSSNQLVTNHQVGMRISILKGSGTGTAVYTETQKPTTNTNGLVSIEIGGGSGFDAIDWANDKFFIKTETDVSGGTNYTISGASQLLSVPYALYAKTSENGLTLPFSKSINSASQAFTITNTNGYAIRGISNGAGIGVYGENTSNIGSTTGVYGKTVSATGFGVHGSSPFVGVRGWSDTIAGLSYGVLGLAESPDGFAVWGRNMAKSGSSVGVFGKSDSPAGFGVYGASQNIGVYGASQNVGIKGVSTGISGSGVAGIGVNIGVGGSATGTSGQVYAISGETQSPVGYGVYGGSYSNTGTTFGIYGKVNSPDGFSGYFDGGKFFINSKVGIGIADPKSNLHIHSSSTYNGIKITNDPSGVTNTDGLSIGMQYQGNVPGNKYAQILFHENYSLLIGTNNNWQMTLTPEGKFGIGTTMPGAGLHVKGTGFPQSFIFAEASATNDAGFRLYEGETAKWHIYNYAAAGGLNICNSIFASAIFAKQSNSFVGINTITPNYNLEVNGTAGKASGGSWSTSSDIRLKNVSGKYNKGLNEIAALQPILFKYKEGNARNLPFNTEQIGFVAQDVQKVFPEAVTKAEDGYLDFNIHAINVALVNAVKELKAENELLKSKNEQIESRLTNLEKIISASAMK